MILRGVAGRYGGYELARQPSEISVGDIVEATIGAISIVDCLDDREKCLQSESCECRLVYSLINQRISEVLRSYTLADLLDPEWIGSADRRLERLTTLPPS